MTQQAIDLHVNSRDENNSKDSQASQATDGRRKRKWGRNPVSARPGQVRAGRKRRGLLGPRNSADVYRHW